MTIPGMRTSLFMVFAVRSRNCSILRPEVIRICILGMEMVDVSEFSSLERGYRIARAALVADDSNYRVREPRTWVGRDQLQLTRGSTSVGLSWMA